MTIQEEIDFVGARKKCSWFTRNLMDISFFREFVTELVHKGEKSGKSVRAVLYALFPIIDYIAEQVVEISTPRGKQEWIRFLGEYREKVIELVIRHGVQGNIPQRGALVLDYIHKSKLFPDTRGVVVEIGCAAGLVGRVLTSSLELFIQNNGALAKKYFWLTRYPNLDWPYDITYVGVDRTIPPPNLVPYYIQDGDKREKVVEFAKSTKPVTLIQLSQGVDLEGLQFFFKEPIVLLTSFLLYQLPNPGVMVSAIEEFLKNNPGANWLDLSRKSEDIELFFSDRCVDGHIYLSHNGSQVAHIVRGTDDCADWEYL